VERFIDDKPFQRKDCLGMSSGVNTDAIQEPGPCDVCWLAEKCGAQALACSAFTMFAEGAPATRWARAARVDASRDRYEKLFGKVAA
jgi:hypothetical protein